MTPVDYRQVAEDLRADFPNITWGTCIPYNQANIGNVTASIGRYRFSVYRVGPRIGPKGKRWVATYGRDAPLPLAESQVFATGPYEAVKGLLNITRDFLATELDLIHLGLSGCTPNELEPVP